MMRTATASRGRPRGTQRAEFTSFVSAHGQFTLRDVARTLKCGVDQANQVLRRALAAQEVQPIGTVRVPDAKRPLAVYGPPGAQADTGSIPLALAMRSWATR